MHKIILALYLGFLLAACDQRQTATIKRDGFLIGLQGHELTSTDGRFVAQWDRADGNALMHLSIAPTQVADPVRSFFPPVFLPNDTQVRFIWVIDSPRVWVLSKNRDSRCYELIGKSWIERSANQLADEHAAILRSMENLEKAG